MDFIVKWSENYPVGQVLFFRGFIGLFTLFCFVVYGQNPNSGTVNMSGAVKLADSLKKSQNKTPICFYLRL